MTIFSEFRYGPTLSHPPGAFAALHHLGPTNERRDWQRRVQGLQLLITQPRDGVVELRMSGEIDLANVESLRDAARRSVASGDYSALVIDLLGVEFIDSSGLHALTEAHNAMASSGGTTTIVCAAPNLLRVFELTGLNNLLTIVDDRPRAYAAAA